MPEAALRFKRPIGYIGNLQKTGGSTMHTIIVIAGGFALLAACLLVARFTGKDPGSMARAAMLFIPLWFAGAGINMLVGIFKAGYSFVAEAPIFLVAFGIPALFAYALARWVFTA